MTMLDHVIALTGVPNRQAYAAMANYVPLPAYTSLSCLLQETREWSKNANDLHTAWPTLLKKYLRGCSYQPAFANGPLQRFGLLTFPGAADPREGHPPGTHQVWVTCPFGTDAEAEITLLFDADLFTFATFCQKHDNEMASLLLAQLERRGANLQTLPETLPHFRDAQTAPFARYEVAQLLWQENALHVDFSTIP